MMLASGTGWCSSKKSYGDRLLNGTDPFTATQGKVLCDCDDSETIKKLEARVKKLEDRINYCGQKCWQIKDGFKCKRLTCEEDDNTHLLPCSAPGKCTGGPS